MSPNHRIFLNIIATYGRLLYALVCGLFTARWGAENRRFWYNIRIGMDQKRHMLWQSDARVRYSAAYPTGVECVFFSGGVRNHEIHEKHEKGFLSLRAQ